MNSRRDTASSVTRNRLCCALALALAGAPALALADNTPQAQEAAAPAQPQDLQGLPPTTAPQQGFVLRGVRFAGNSVYTDAELQALVAGRIGRPATLADLQAIAQRITDMYQARGYLFAQALVPVQEVKDGVVEISVVEGRLGSVKLDMADDVPVSADRVRAILAPVAAGQPLNGMAYERSMLLLSDLPGIKAQSALETGTAPGSSDLTVQVSKAPPTQWVVGLDNFGTREAGRLRLGGSMRWNEPFGIGDNLDARALVSQHAGTAFGRLSYEAPLGYTGPRLGVGVARVDYSLGGAFEALDAIGTADIYDASLRWPLVRQRNQNLFLRVGIDHKRLTDKLRAVGFVSHKRVQGVNVGWTWERRDTWFGGGYWSTNGVLYAGDLHIRDPLLRAVDQGPFGAHTEGGFVKLTFQLARLQAMGEKSSLYLALGGQMANHNLDASEKLSLGGHDAVRAYPTGEVLVDQGFIGTIEWRRSLREDLTGYVFYDASRGWLNRSHATPGGRPIRSLRGPGIGLNWARPGNFSIDLSVAWRTTEPAATGGGDQQPRVFFNLQKFF